MNVTIPKASLDKLRTVAGRLAPQMFLDACARAYQRLGAKTSFLVTEAKRRCPISPTKAEYEATLTGRGKAKWGASTQITFTPKLAGGVSVSVGASTHKTSRRNFNPGQLTASITADCNRSQARIFCLPSSPAAAYAGYIHDGGPHGYKAWKKRGVGTVRKGPQADDLFLFRAVDDNINRVVDVFAEEIDKALQKWKGTP